MTSAVTRYVGKTKAFLITFPVCFLDQEVVECIVVQQVIILPIILRVIAFIVQVYIIVSKEEIQSFYCGKIRVSHLLISPEYSLFSLDFNLFKVLYIFLFQEMTSLIPCAVNENDPLYLFKLICIHAYYIFYVCRGE